MTYNRCGCGGKKAHRAFRCRTCQLAEPRYPMAPLDRVTEGTDTDRAAAFGLTPAGVKGLRRRGLSVAQADKYAIRAGFHPSELWPDWLEDAS